MGNQPGENSCARGQRGRTDRIDVHWICAGKERENQSLDHPSVSDLGTGGWYHHLVREGTDFRGKDGGLFI